MKKKILLIHKNKKIFNFFQKRFKNISFINNIKSHSKDINAFISFDRKNFDRYLKRFNLKNEKNLKWIHIPFSGIENYEYLRKFNKIILTSAKNIISIQVAEHAIALLLSISRKISFLSKFGIKKKFISKPIELKNKKVLIIGYGAIGKAIVKRLYSFETKISLVVNKNIKKQNFIEKIYYKKYLTDAIKRQDIIFITIPINKENYSIFKKKHFQSLKKDSIVINVSREDIFDQKYLINFIKKNKKVNFGIDFFSQEFLKKNKSILKQQNVTLTPHIAGLSDTYMSRHLDLLSNNIKNFQNKKKLTNRI